MVWRKKPAQRREDRRQPSEQIQTEMFLSARLVIHYGAEAFQRREARSLPVRRLLIVRPREHHGEPMEWGKRWALLFARLVLGLIFFMAGVWKVFTLGPAEHARRLFVTPYTDTFLPAWALWAAGVTVPFVELAAGTLVLLGWLRRPAYLALGGVLVLVAFGHLLLQPLYAFHEHVIPRLGLLLFLLWHPLEADSVSADAWIQGRQRG